MAAGETKKEQSSSFSGAHETHSWKSSSISDPVTGQTDEVEDDATSGNQKDQIRSEQAISNRKQSL